MNDKNLKNKAQMHFNKMHVCGNDFVIISQKDLDYLSKEKLKDIANRKTGIGCDQILVIKNFNTEDNLAKIDIYNSDGSIAETCINGTLCIAWHLMRENLLQNIKICSFRDILNCHINGKEVYLKLPYPTFDWDKIPITKPCDTLHIQIPGITESAIAINLGNPHIIFFTTDKNNLTQLELFASKVTESRLFNEGVNISLCFFDGNNTIHARVFERGVGKTLSCGSAASCIYFAAKKKYIIEDNTPILISFPGGVSKIFYNKESHFITSKINFVFSGVYNNF